MLWAEYTDYDQCQNGLFQRMSVMEVQKKRMDYMDLSDQGPWMEEVSLIRP